MLQTIAIIVIVIVVLIAALLAFAASKPDTFRIERRASIKAPAETIFPLINDFHSWTSWSPWEKMDPTMKRTYSGAPSGVGAMYAWEGNKTVGKGGMEITHASPPHRVEIKLDFLKPFEAHHTAEFALEPQGDATNVSWAMKGHQAFFFKVMSIFMNMDKMIGKDFEKGLANLKSVTEK
jgi:uncharacterized protein YndB with AHSA1/START domain